MITTRDLAQYSEGYTQAYPFPHIVLDDLFKEEDLKDILTEWPKDNDPAWNKKRCNTSWKWHISQMSAMGPKTQIIFQELNSSEFLEDLEKLTGIPGLYRDPYLAGGGLHYIPVGGFLEMHVDFNWHPQLQKVRRINMLIYLNEDWVEEDKGEIELWESDMSKAGAKVSPIFNRTVIFNTTDQSWHGHPDPAKSKRKSIAFYYYTSGVVKEAHSTLYTRRPIK
jgi:Rps23 Pro-64 3,4-dihydroxylase Tpa1-like proline 4-hydroxylase